MTVVPEGTILVISNCSWLQNEVVWEVLQDTIYIVVLSAENLAIARRKYEKLVNS